MKRDSTCLCEHLESFHGDVDGKCYEELCPCKKFKRNNFKVFQDILLEFEIGRN